jgi:tRNA (uracil-5-)-methyltransferase TRM9
MTDDLPRAPRRVREVYDEIATHFSQTREYPWPEVEDFLERTDGGEIGLDVGCGNGRHVAPLAGVTGSVLALDLSREVLAEARSRLAEESHEAALLQGDAATLPFVDGSIDVAISIATVHHLADRETRVQSLGELGRVLAPDGHALVSAWSTAHDRFDAEADATAGFDTTLDWTLPNGETLPRFYHVYAPAEFEADLERAGLTVDDSYVSSGNCYAEVRR